MIMAETVIRIKNLVVEYLSLAGPLRAVDNVSLDVYRREWMGIVGESGSGKSTLAYTMIGLLPPPGRVAGGSIVFNGKDLTRMSKEELRMLRGKEISMVFQDPMTSLDPLRRVGDQIAEVAVEHGVADWKEAREMAAEALESVGIPREAVYRYPHELSGGQRQRVMIAIAMLLKPKLLIADEPTTALDVIVQESIMDLFGELKKMGTSIVLITHDIALAAERSDRIAVMYAAKLAELGPVDKIINDPLHPYTRGLIESTPDVWSDKPVKSIPGYPPDLRRPPRGCRFHPRCPHATDKCKHKEPPITKVGDRLVACWLYAQEG